jgi:hypothetical protein
MDDGGPIGSHQVTLFFRIPITPSVDPAWASTVRPVRLFEPVVHLSL